MNYDEIAHLRSQHAAWVLLRSNNVALVLSFLGRIFVDGNASGIPASELADQLDDELFALNQRLGEDAFPRSATAYLDDWASPEHGWLRKYYPAGADEAHFDLAPAVSTLPLFPTWSFTLFPTGLRDSFYSMAAPFTRRRVASSSLS
jgi:hypothetical protein